MIWKDALFDGEVRTGREMAEMRLWESQNMADTDKQTKSETAKKGSALQHPKTQVETKAESRFKMQLIERTRTGNRRL